MTKNKLTAKQHRLRRVLKKNQNNIDAMGHGARKISNKFNQVTITGNVCDAMKNGKAIRVYLGSIPAQIDFWGETYEPFN